MKKDAALKLLIAAVIALIIAALLMIDGRNFGTWSLLPPLAAILLAFATKQVVLSLFIGVFSGTAMMGQGSFWGKLLHGFIGAFSKIVGSVADEWNAGILVFTLMIGAWLALFLKWAELRRLHRHWLKRLKQSTPAINNADGGDSIF